MGYSARPVDDQVLIKKRLNLLLKRILRGIPPEHRLAIDTGDGAAVCFLGEPLAALQAALLLRELLGQRYGPSLSLRIGLHRGPVRVVPDVNGRLNVVGDGINAAQRIMDFAKPNQVLVSRALRDAVADAGLPPHCERRAVGLQVDKHGHGRAHDLYRVQDVPLRTGEPAAGYAISAWSPEDLATLERALTRRIGPMARLLMEQALAGGLAGASADADLPRALAVHIADSTQREGFLEDARRLQDAGRLRR